MQAMRGAAQQMAVVQHPTGSPNKRRRGGPQRSAAWEPWQHSAQVAARAGRMARELHEQAVESCQVSCDAVWGMVCWQVVSLLYVGLQALASPMYPHHQQQLAVALCKPY